MKFKLKYYVINLQNESDLKEFGINVKEGKSGTLTLTNPLQKEEIDWAGFVPIEEAKKRIAKYQIPIIERYERGNIVNNSGDKKINRFLLIKKETGLYSKSKNYLVEQYALDIKDTATGSGYYDKNGVDIQIIYWVKKYTDEYNVLGKPNELLHEPIYIFDLTGKDFVERYKKFMRGGTRQGYEKKVEKELARIVVLTSMPQKMESGGNIINVGDYTNVGIVEDKTETQFLIDGRWFHKSLVAKIEKNEDVKINHIISKLKRENGEGNITLYHGTDNKSYENILKSGILGDDRGITFFTSNKTEAKLYAKNKSKYRNVDGNGKVIKVTIPKYAVTKRASTGEYETEFKLQKQGDLYVPTKDSLLNKMQSGEIQFNYGGEIDYDDFDDWIFNKKVLETKLKMFVKLLK